MVAQAASVHSHPRGRLAIDNIETAQYGCKNGSLQPRAWLGHCALDPSGPRRRCLEMFVRRAGISASAARRAISGDTSSAGGTEPPRQGARHLPAALNTRDIITYFAPSGPGECW